VFDKIRFRLLTAYLLVLAGILITFSIGVRVLFHHVLSQKITENLTTIAHDTMMSIEIKDGRLQFDSIGETLNERDLSSRQVKPADNPLIQKLFTETGIEIFDRTGKRVARSRRVNLTLPLSIQQPIQFQAGRVRIQGVTLPIIDSDNNRTIGYIRSSQPLTELEENLTKLDLGLSGGILLALMLSSIGGIWLTTQAMEPVEASFQRLQQFTADASHELRSPLMAIKTNARVALKYPVGMRTGDGDKFESIDSATTQMTRLTEDLLWLARTDGANFQQRESIDLTEVLTDVLRSHQASALDKKIDLHGEISPTLTVTGDRSQLLRVFTNLVENALHYTPDGGTVIVTAERIRQQIIVRVQDTGMGIAPAHLSKIFNRFWRADTSRTQWEGGSGLGLSIVWSIVSRHDGKITVSSQVGCGSCFTVRLRH
jgi:two-component system, OmpR family, manganese sensing sensor histidine kinase